MAEALDTLRGGTLNNENGMTRFAIRYTNIDVLATVQGSLPWRRYAPPLLFMSALAALCVGVARPQARTLVATDKATVILVLDQSGSMFAQDLHPSRLGAAQAAVRTFLDKVPKRIRVGLIVFAGEAQVAAPPTSDHELVRASVDALGTSGSSHVEAGADRRRDAREHAALEFDVEVLPEREPILRDVQPRRALPRSRAASRRRWRP